VLSRLIQRVKHFLQKQGHSERKSPLQRPNKLHSRHRQAENKAGGVAFRFMLKRGFNELCAVMFGDGAGRGSEGSRGNRKNENVVNLIDEDEDEKDEQDFEDVRVLGNSASFPKGFSSSSSSSSSSGTGMENRRKRPRRQASAPLLAQPDRLIDHDGHRFAKRRRRIRFRNEDNGWIPDVPPFRNHGFDDEDMRKAIERSKAEEATRLRQQQDEAFYKSQILDQAKEEERNRKEAEERRAQEQREWERKRKEQNKQRKIQRKEEKKKQIEKKWKKLEMQLEGEPLERTEGTITVMLHLRKGRFQRRFSKMQSVLDLMRWVMIEDTNSLESNVFEISNDFAGVRFRSDMDIDELKSIKLGDANVDRNVLRVRIIETNDDDDL